jgi:hypothetical protein
MELTAGCLSTDQGKRAAVNYPFENLNDESFQQICQALIVKEHPGVQCFPVGQPDGGRDATSRPERGSGKFVVFQVKFVRNPTAITNPRAWLLDIVTDEMPKVKALIDKSAQGYYVVTNVQGSAHLDRGSIDKMNAEISGELDIPSMCWWRDDLARRLDGAWDIKWAYPQIMTGPDFLRAVIEGGINREEERYDRTLRAFLTDQYSRDAKVRFRQLDLQCDLLDLFVDVPIRKNRPRERNTEIAEVFDTTCMQIVQEERSQESEDQIITEHASYREYLSVGAAAFFLSAQSSRHFSMSVLEGAPGQGKSTISQLICQTHRARLLRRDGDLKRLPAERLTGPLKLPIKVDLRDLAVWLGGDNPFLPLSPKTFPLPWQPQLESFVATLITFHSGGQVFTVTDLVAVLNVSSVCLVLDGLDEVAEISTRTTVIDAIVSGTTRLKSNAAALQVIVTSRPAAFSNSPGIPEDKFPHLALGPLTPPLINEYFTLWCKARQIVPAIQEELKNFIAAKLSQPHIAELARNPMQLTILLSLLNARGASLPDKRTALYDSYIDHFLNREAEKSETVRRHRDVLLELHRYLAWVMHTDSEAKGGRGMIAQDHIVALLEAYLRQEGRDPSIANELFQGMVERVFALVSRVQGTLEFEVQPLREYFVARYLFETAPMSSPGKESPGARPDRFRAIARSSYWLNVARFYAGCYSKGEIPSLVHSLGELYADPVLSKTTVPTTLSIALIRDWVFWQVPRSVADVVNFFDVDNQLFIYLSDESSSWEGRYASSGWALPADSGRAEFVEKCLNALNLRLPHDHEMVILRALRQNCDGSRHVVDGWLKRVRDKSGADFERWLRFGRYSGVLSALAAPEIETLPLRASKNHALELLSAGRGDILKRDVEMFSEAEKLLLDGVTHSPQTSGCALDTLIIGLDADYLGFGFVEGPLSKLTDVWQSINEGAALKTTRELARQEGDLAGSVLRVRTFAQVLIEQAERQAIDAATKMDVCRCIIESAVACWGERRAIWRLAFVTAAIRGVKYSRRRIKNLCDRKFSLVERARFARSASRNRGYWQEQLSVSIGVEDKMFVVLAILVSCSIDVLVGLSGSLSTVIAQFGADDWWWLTSHYGRLRANYGHTHLREIHVQRLPQDVSTRMACVLAQLAEPNARLLICERFLKTNSIDDSVVNSLRAWWALDLLNIGTIQWKPNLELVSSAFLAGGWIMDPELRVRKPLSKRVTNHALSVLAGVLEDPLKYPLALVRYAAMLEKHNVLRRLPTVRKAAESEQWFQAHACAY